MNENDKVLYCRAYVVSKSLNRENGRHVNSSYV